MSIQRVFTHTNWRCQTDNDKDKMFLYWDVFNFRIVDWKMRKWNYILSLLFLFYRKVDEHITILLLQIVTDLNYPNTFTNSVIAHKKMSKRFVPLLKYQKRLLQYVRKQIITHFIFNTIILYVWIIHSLKAFYTFKLYFRKF